MRIFLAIYVFAIVAAVSILGFRGSKSTKPPLEVFPDMDRQARYKPQAANAFFTDARDDRPIPGNTVARGNFFNQAEVFSAEFDDTTLGDTVLNQGKNADGSFVQKVPLEVNHALMAEGQEKFDIFCAVCHGAAGDGNGVTKPYGVLAANYHDARLRDVEDGYIFDVITNGKGLMLPFNGRISPDERWAIVAYLRALQLSQNANAKDLSDAQRTELGIK
ncbi:MULTISPECIES: cytochrome c [unclassified Lentimonas]|uniref:c-type cytochrome n=1 Tax=unclassified Lentimonas TaxID=2630993 RepID=UPI0013206477|nr:MULTISPECIES: cytochrome c [unclassified Lentimonas]CAA6679030.1 ABC-type Fe3+ transport system protein; Molybdenum transport protein, putative [Lentimonas sp. CC4]CAA6684230.1 ABC-type Fe3+ transport system protein; Molybdenum transport protein, putative [Lentimonas sp. CC6]CAA6693669.1 ABC-type Fe3+ transport system protein; Molybdenum transport protein, putative [Lentimonas sp. CC10]CAA6696057.1 ABC-type Fe3+ transport system protein; Molybdenum transport protein, putative [Lentimonas sp.